MTPSTMTSLADALATGLTVVRDGYLIYLGQSTLLIVVTWCLTRLLPTKQYQQHNTLWRVALASAVVTAILTTWLIHRPSGATSPMIALTVEEDIRYQLNHVADDMRVEDVDIDIVSNAIDIFSPDAEIDANVELVTGFVAWQSNLLNLVFGFMVLGVAIRGIRYGQQLRQLHHVLSLRQTISDGLLMDRLEHNLKTLNLDTLNISRPIKLSSCPNLTSPVALLGWEICVPEGFESKLEPAELEAVLAHELAHLRCWDPQWLGLAHWLELLQPCNRLARICMTHSAEFLADEWAVQHTGERLALAQALAKVASHIQTRRTLQLVNAVPSLASLSARVAQILDDGLDDGRPISSSIPIGFLISTVVVVVFVITIWLVAPLSQSLTNSISFSNIEIERDVWVIDEP